MSSHTHIQQNVFGQASLQNSKPIRALHYVPGRLTLNITFDTDNGVIYTYIAQIETLLSLLLIELNIIIKIQLHKSK